MSQAIDALMSRQKDIANDEAPALALPKFSTYTICNLRGGIGKTSLVFNLSYLTERLLVVDTCPQGNLSYFYDGSFYTRNTPSVYDMLLPHFMPGLGQASRVAKAIEATNRYFADKKNFFIASSDSLYLLPSQIANALAQARTVPGNQQQIVIDGMLYALEKEIGREMSETNTVRCLIDTSPFFSGCTHLAWHASDALIVPVRTDQQSINSLNLLIATLSSPASEFRRAMPSNGHAPRIQMIVLTHCGWSTRAGAKNEPNQPTRMFLEMVRDVVNRNITHFTTDNPDNHIVILDDFLGSGRISTAKSTPIECLEAGESMIINRVKTEVNPSVEKIKRQLRFISGSIW